MTPPPQSNTPNQDKSSNKTQCCNSDSIFRNNADAIARGPWRSDPNGVSHLGPDGVLRSLNAHHTAVLDFRRLSPEELEEFAAPMGQATLDALDGVDGRNVIDETQLWTIPEKEKVVE
ncbi:hypothetical protein E4T48_00507 [Aureobasidium sp. EXF-10727]|nr:hypothetical protein E4T48_00507 [Aureobasidium sp. EXF-10727]KAI4729659.1 hypothetical protein E4T49_02560 [Aureobasidium sp. EXF-10728]